MVAREGGHLNQTTLVSVGLPTRNRAESLRRAIGSVLAQEWAALELVICDNASTDHTEEICRSFAQEDERIRYVRRPEDIGAEANFQDALSLSRGEIFMWLADDDWQDPSYVSACAQMLLDEPDHSLVCGRIKYFRGAEFAFAERETNLLASSPPRRVTAFYRTVTLNGPFYGAMRREQAIRLSPPSGLGGDWLFVAALAYLGKVRTLTDVSLNRSIEGVSKDARSLAESYGLPERAATNWHVSVARLAYNDVVHGSTYSALGRPQRKVVGATAAALVFTRFAGKVWLGRLLVRVGIFGRARAILEAWRRRR
jgi:glycosyltransferase involved in cell wall biosynthesis